MPKVTDSIPHIPETIPPSPFRPAQRSVLGDGRLREQIPGRAAGPRASGRISSAMPAIRRPDPRLQCAANPYLVLNKALPLHLRQTGIQEEWTNMNTMQYTMRERERESERERERESMSNR